MSKTSRHRRADARVRQRRAAIALVFVAAISAIFVAGYFLSRSAPTSGAQPVAEGKTKGLATAPVEIENWSDFQCPHCKTFATTIGARLDQGPIADGQVRLVFRQMAFLGDDSVQAAAASECAADQGQFWAYHDKLFANQGGRGSGSFARPNLKRYGAQLGLDTASFDRCVDSGQTIARVQAETALGEQKGVHSTPTLFVNGQKIEGVPTWESLQRLIDQASAAMSTPSAPQS